MTIFEQLGVHPVVNAAGFLTRLGGSLMSDEVLSAMREAAQHYVPMEALQAAASRTIAEVTGAEAGIVTCGAAAGLLLGAAACMAGLDPQKMNSSMRRLRSRTTGASLSLSMLRPNFLPPKISGGSSPQGQTSSRSAVASLSEARRPAVSCVD